MNTDLRSLVDLRTTLQKNRIAFGQRVQAADRGADALTGDQKNAMQTWEERFKDLEALADEEIKDQVKDIPIVQYMLAVRGVGALLAARFVSMVDISRADTVSALWAYCGYAVREGHRDRPVKGEKLRYNARLKTTCYLIASAFLRSGSPYTAVYYSSKEFYEANRPDWTKAHIHLASMRRMVKVWLSHVWEVWRTLEGLPVRGLYVEERLNHQHIYTPAEFGWQFESQSED